MVARFTYKKTVEQDLQHQLDEIIKIGIQYPKFEQKSFTDTWTAGVAESCEDFARYDLYATLIFNYLERFCRFHNYNLVEMEKELGVSAWIQIHTKYWQNPSTPDENISQYDKRFVKLVEGVIEQFQSVERATPPTSATPPSISSAPPPVG